MKNINEMTLSELAATYNDAASTIGAKPIKKFASLAKGKIRTKSMLTSLDNYNKSLETTTTKAPRSKTKQLCGFPLTSKLSVNSGNYTAREGSINSFVLTLIEHFPDSTIESVLCAIELNFKKPRSNSKVSYSFARSCLAYLIKTTYVDVSC